MDTDEKLPALRPIEILPFRQPDGELYFALHDPARLAPQSMAVSAAGYFVLIHLDGAHSPQDIRAAFRRHTGMELPADEILKLVRALDEGLYIGGERVAQALAARRAAYQAAPARDNRDRYPDGAALRAEIEKVLAGGVAAPVGEVRGLVAPHLDYQRGAPCYADAYATLAASPPAQRYVILGANHAGLATSVVATRKDFWTPLGAVPTDRQFICELEERLGQPLSANEDDHLYEHSIELQVHCLQVSRPDAGFEIVPVLCPDVCGPSGTAPRDGAGPDLRDFARALGAALAQSDRRTVIIAGADLSHVGQRFGDEQPTTPEFLEAIGRTDRQLLALLESRAEEEFLAQLSATGNETRICSTGCLFALLHALPDRPFRLLSYHQAVDMPAEMHVTCAAAVVM
jgi:AmmeMemoRadiSam system protein B